jgi:hypothetical protein
MRRTLRTRVEKLEESFPDEREQSLDSAVAHWLPLLDNWPLEYVSRSRYESEEEFDEKVAELRRQCREFAARVRAGEFSNKREFTFAFPEEAVLGAHGYYIDKALADGKLQ